MRIKIWQVITLILMVAAVVLLVCYEAAYQIVAAVEKVIEL